MPSIAPSICVVIINYHSQALVNDCLDHLMSLRREDIEYLIVDNSEQPDTELIKSRHPEVVIHRSLRNLGFAAGCNVGFRHALSANADYVLLLNPDIRVENDFIQPLVTALEADPLAGMAGPVIIEDTSARCLWQGIGRLTWWLGGPIQRSRSPNQHSKQQIDVPFLSGCALLIRVEALKNVGFMDERYFLYFEDTDYCLRFSYRGWKVLLVPAAQIFHAQSSTIGRHSQPQVYFLSRNRIWLTRRWAEIHEFVIFMLINSFIKIPVMLYSFIFFHRQPKLIRAFLKGYVDGIRVFKIKVGAKIYGL